MLESAKLGVVPHWKDTSLEMAEIFEDFAWKYIVDRGFCLVYTKRVGQGEGENRVFSRSCLQETRRGDPKHGKGCTENYVTPRDHWGFSWGVFLVFSLEPG